MHLASIGFPSAGDGTTRLVFWDWYLWAHGLPEVDAVGIGLPDTHSSGMSINGKAPRMPLTAPLEASWSSPLQAVRRPRRHKPGIGPSCSLI